MHDENKSRAVALGVAMGILALTKAAFFYIGIVFILLLFLPERLKLGRQKDHQSLRQLRVTYGVLIAAFSGNVISVGHTQLNYKWNSRDRESR